MEIDPFRRSNPELHVHTHIRSNSRSVFHSALTGSVVWTNSHVLHAVRPVSVGNVVVPLVHDEHVDVLWATTLEYVPAGHDTHVPLLASVPAGHATHVPEHVGQMVGVVLVVSLHGIVPS